MKTTLNKIRADIISEHQILKDKVHEIQLATVKATLEKVATNENLYLGTLQRFRILKVDPESIIEQLKIMVNFEEQGK